MEVARGVVIFQKIGATHKTKILFHLDDIEREPCDFKSKIWLQNGQFW